MKFNVNNYTVTMDLKSPEFGMSKSQLSGFESNLEKIGSADPEFWRICSYENGVLRYESETLLPAQIDGSKQKVLMVLGNPAIHSVQNGMFFFSDINGDPHNFWNKLAIAGLVYRVPESTRYQEAVMRREMVLNGTASEKYLVGFTTFYSFPTPGPDNSTLSGVKGVKKLFKPIIDQVSKNETLRILSYQFTDGAIIVFDQKSSHEKFTEIASLDAIPWPKRGEGSGGKNLAKLISESSAINL